MSKTYIVSNGATVLWVGVALSVDGARWSALFSMPEGVRVRCNPSTWTVEES